MFRYPTKREAQAELALIQIRIMYIYNVVATYWLSTLFARKEQIYKSVLRTPSYNLSIRDGSLGING